MTSRMSVGRVVVFLLVCGFGTAAFRPAGGQDEGKVTREDLPRIPATEPADALSTFQVAKGFSLELVAAEPMVGDPVDACFDADGRMYVAEMHGYPFSQEPTRLNPNGGGKPDAGIIRLLEDTDGDGRMDRSHVFADQISWPTSVCCYDGGVFVLAPRYLYYFKDTDGDHRADVREIVLSGFGRDNVQSLANNMKWGLDNRIYFAGGRNGGKIEHRGEPLFEVRGRDIRFDPRTETFELVSGGLQFGHSFDNWGNRFVCSNSNHIQQVVFPQEYLERNPYLAAPAPVRSIARDGASAQVFRTSPPEPWRIIRQKWRALAKGYRLVVNDDGSWEFIPLDSSKKKGAVPTEYPVGYFTSATGITIYRGGAYPPSYRGNAFVGDVGGNLVHRKVLSAQGVAHVADRADAGSEFIRSSDNWFRPVNFVNAPDGTLYVLDMYRETVEHPYSIPDEIKQFLYLYSGSDRGRVYRIARDGMPRRRAPRMSRMSAVALVQQLESEHGWHRQTAQRLIWERQDAAAVEPLARLVRTSQRPEARLHALYALAGLQALEADTLRAALADAHPRVREHAIRLAEPALLRDTRLLEAVSALAGDDDARIRYQLAFSLGEVPADSELAVDTLAVLARDPRTGPDVRVALLSSVAHTADRLAIRLLGDKEFLASGRASGMLTELGRIIGANPDARATLRLLEVVSGEGHDPETRRVVLAALGTGLSRRGASLSKVLSAPSAPADLRQRMQQLFARAAGEARDAERELTARAAALRLLAFADPGTATDVLPEFLQPQLPQPLQRAAVESLAQQSGESIGRRLLDGWKTYTPRIRGDVLDAMLASRDRTRVLLAALDAGQVKRGDIPGDKRQRLTSHPDKAIRAKASELFAGDVQSDRARVVAQYQKVLELDGRVDAGFELFKKKCSVCHKVGEMGHEVAPPLASVQNKAPGDLLIAVLDPNREAQPNFNTYTVVTLDGKIYTGMIASESTNSLTLKREEAKQDVILRDNIDMMIANGVSLMPEGLEKDLSPQDLADVIAFIKSIRPEPKTP